MNVWLPAALRYGISYNDFWKLNPRILSFYQDAYLEKMKEQVDTINYAAWLHGQYHLMAIGASMNKKIKYPKRPLETGQSGSKISDEEKFLLWMQEFNKRFD